MSAYLKIFALAALAHGLSGCAAQSNRVVTGGPDAEEAAIRLESSKREYYDCLANEAPGRPTCDSLKALYEQDRDAFERTAK